MHHRHSSDDAQPEAEVSLLADRTALIQANADLQHLNQELSEQIAHLQALIEIMPVGIAIASDPSCAQMQHNAYLRQVLGVSPGHNISKSAPAEEQPSFCVLQNGQKLLADDLPMQISARLGIDVRDVEIEIQPPEGQSRHLLAYSSPIRDDENVIKGAIAAFLDITQLKCTEAQLRDNENRLHLALNASHMGIWDWEVKHDRVTWAGDNEKLFGLAKGSFAGTYEAFLDCVHPDDRNAVQHCVSEALQEKRGYIQDVRIIYPDGTIRWLRTQSELFLDSQGNPERLIGTNQDITDKKQSEILLRESERQYKLLANSIYQIIWVANGKGEFQFVNDRWSEYCGMTYSDASQNWQAVIHPDDQEWCQTQWQIALRDRTPCIIEFRFRRADGEYRWHINHCIPVIDATGEVEQWVATITDIHPCKCAEQRAEQAYAAEQYARSEAEAASRMKDEFLAIVSHELRSPLNAMLGWSKLLKAGRLNEAMRAKAVQVIERNAEAQTQLIEDLLDISRIIRGKVRLTLAPVNLIQVIESAIDTVRPSADIKHIQIDFLHHTSTAFVTGDLDRLQQVVWNLLSNAVKFTPEGGRVGIELIQVGTQIQVRVIDTGKGIRPDFLPYVFDRFRQAENATTRTTAGLGLGLAIVHNLVEMHGGRVRVESQGEGKGTTFMVELPLLENAQIQEHLLEINQLSSDNSSLEGMRVLVVDDELDTRDFLVATLELFGAKTVSAASSSEGLQQMMQFKPDVVVSDIGMPNEDGYEFIEKVRSLPRDQGGNVPAVALTAFARQEDRHQAIAAGFQIHVAKPIEPLSLVSIIRTLTLNSG